MERDFHYYGTYTAAIIAGYTEEEASEIAFGAQYVDDSTEGQVRYLRNKYGSTINYLISCQSTAEIGVSTTKTTFSKEEENKLRNIWSLFHFLPGNLDKHIGYTGPTSRTSGPIKTWSFGTRSDWELKLLCTPNSPLVEFMINDIINNKKEMKNFLTQLIGVRMHVLADTWAHAYFVGTPSWCINEVGDNVYWYDENNNRSLISWGIGSSSETSTPPGLSYYSVAYLGHGRMGHLPDMPFLKYAFSRHILSNGEIIKDNPVDYMHAFKQMVVAMKSIKNGSDFKLTGNDYNNVNELAKQKGMSLEDIQKIINHRQKQGENNDNRIDNRCKCWKDYLNSKNLHPPEYDYENKKQSDYAMVYNALNHHAKSIYAELINKGNIDINNAPDYDSVEKIIPQSEIVNKGIDAVVTVANVVGDTATSAYKKVTDTFKSIF